MQWTGHIFKCNKLHFFYSFGVQSTLPGLLFVYHFVLIVHLKQCVISGVRQLRTNEKSEYSTQNILNTSGWQPALFGEKSQAHVTTWRANIHVIYRRQKTNLRFGKQNGCHVFRTTKNRFPMITSNLISSNSWHFPYTKTWKLRKEQVEFSEFCINRWGIFSTIEFRYQQNIYLFQTIFLHLTPFILIKKAFKNVQNYLPTEVQEDNFHWAMVKSLVKD